MQTTGIETAAAALLEARGARRRMVALPAAARPAQAEDGYRIQEALIEAIGAPCVGWKIGGTSPLAQEMLKLSEPFAGRLLAPLLHDSPARLAADGFFMRGIEVEFALRLGADLDAAGAPYDRHSVAAAVAAVHPAIEVVDSRFDDWLGVGTLSLIADNACHGALVLGPAVADWRHLDLAHIATELYMQGVWASAGSGAEVLGHPLEALAWLANLRLRHGGHLSAGELVTTGSTCAALGWAEAGDVAEGRFAGLGSVRLEFT